MKMVRNFLYVMSVTIWLFSYVATTRTDSPESLTDMDGFNTFQESLSPAQREECASLIDKLIEVGNAIQEHCQKGLKHNNIMLKYRQFAHLDQLCFNVGIGCTQKNDDPIVCRDISILDEFNKEGYLSIEQLKPFNDTLNPEEQQQLEGVLQDMFAFCKQVINNLVTLLNEYPGLKSKLEEFLNQTDQELVLLIGFDAPFPLITFKIA